METDKIEFIPEGTVTSPAGFFAGAVYAGIKKAKDSLDKGQTPWTPAISLLYQLRRAIQMLEYPIVLTKFLDPLPIPPVATPVPGSGWLPSTGATRCVAWWPT